MSIPIHASTRPGLVQIARQFLRVPYLEGGRDVRGCDCWGLVRMIYWEAYGIDLPLLQVKPGIQAAKNVLRASRSVDWIMSNGRAGDVVVVRQRSIPGHVGLLLTRNDMIHTLPDVGVTVERTDSIRWRNKILGYYRPAKLPYM